MFIISIHSQHQIEYKQIDWSKAEATPTNLNCPIFDFNIRNLREIFVITSNNSAANGKSDSAKRRLRQRSNPHIFFQSLFC
jgi:hypothetical protein